MALKYCINQVFVAQSNILLHAIDWWIQPTTDPLKIIFSIGSETPSSTDPPYPTRPLWYTIDGLPYWQDVVPLSELYQRHPHVIVNQIMLKWESLWLIGASETAMTKEFQGVLYFISDWDWIQDKINPWKAAEYEPETEYEASITKQGIAAILEAIETAVQYFKTQGVKISERDLERIKKEMLAKMPKVTKQKLKEKPKAGRNTLVPEIQKEMIKHATRKIIHASIPSIFTKPFAPGMKPAKPRAGKPGASIPSVWGKHEKKIRKAAERKVIKKQRFF